MIKRDLNSYFAGDCDESTIIRLRLVIDSLRSKKQTYEEMRKDGYKCRDKVTDKVIPWEGVLADIDHKLNEAEQEYKEVSIRLKKSQIDKEFEEDCYK